MMQKCCYCYSLKTGALLFGIFFSVNSLFHLFIGFFFFISKTRFYQDDIPKSLSAGSLAVGLVLLVANISLIEGVIKRCRRRLLLWELLHALLLPAYAAAAATLCATLLGTAHFLVLRRLCPQVVAALFTLLAVHGACQVFAFVVVESLRREFMRDSPPLKLDKAYKPLERY